MIVRSQVYSLRFVIVVLSTLICALGYYSYTNYTSLNEYHEFLLNENASVEAELNQMVLNYDMLQVDNRDLQARLDDSKLRISRILDSVKYLKPDVYLVAHYKKQLEVLKDENNKIYLLVEELNAENVFLKEEAIRVNTELDQTIYVSKSLKTENSTLSRINDKFERQINKAKALSVKNVMTEGVRRVTNSGRIKSTLTAKRARKINVCFTVPENKFAAKGKKELYIQILDPSNNVVGDRGVINVGEQSLIFSEQLVVDYDNVSLQECVFIEPLPGEPFQKGTYFVSIYHENTLIGKTTMELK
ncbi:hypothetical protein [Psychroserpens sp. NJDZ02]|uniref:hypothetical protein n=1 Tax=Psychroserpens sp. NJDZ02 TaxID=2570561 RepID=UPI0010A93948|nr:hypothetical protein [Psychroserpens sp. NJDZ02]QCE40923.1 hypothetical protein E9099_05650 [Psychroserpens sp. NJDZ02]